MDEIGAAFSEITSIPAQEVHSIGRRISIPQFSVTCIKSLFNQATKVLEATNRMVNITGDVIIVGDLHGNFHDLLRIFGSFGTPATVKYLFLGDYVDRGDYSLEVVLLLFYYLVLYPYNITLLRGNHEFSDVNKQYGYLKEIEDMYGDEEIWIESNNVFSYLPIAAIINRSMFCVHGGLSSQLQTLSQITLLPIPMNNDNLPEAIKTMLWSDPSDAAYFFSEGNRGFNEGYGRGALKKFLETFSFKYLIRAHQCVPEGYSKFNHNCYTVFSSSSYTNDGAILQVLENQTIKGIIYKAIDYPLRSDASFFRLSKPKAIFGGKLHISTSLNKMPPTQSAILNRSVTRQCSVPRKSSALANNAGRYVIKPYRSVSPSLRFKKT